MAVKKTEIIDIAEDPITSEIFISGEPEDNMPAPVPAVDHVSGHSWGTTPYQPESKILPLATAIIASVVTGAALISIGILIGAGL